MGFDKFEWIRAVAADRRLKVAERFVLRNAAVRYVKYGDDVFRVRQTTIADQLAVGVRTVRQSISQARQLGYLVLAQERQRGRSYHGPNEYRLVIPADSAAINRIPAEHDPNSGTDRPEYRQNTTGIAAERNSLTSQNADPKGSLKGLIKGIERGGAPAASPPGATPSTLSPEDDPPSHYCKRHPNGTDDPCAACGKARRKREAWDAEEAPGTWQADEPAVVVCDLCNKIGWLLGQDGWPVMQRPKTHNGDPMAVSCKHSHDENEQLVQQLRMAGTFAGTIRSPVSLPDLADDNIIDAELVNEPPGDPEPPQYCPAHMPHGTSNPCKACKTA